MIEIKNLYLKYIREYYALYDINIKIQKGESVALVGNEGSGKTTLLRVLAKLEKFDKGEVYIKDISLKKLDFKTDISLGYIPFSPVFLENKTVYENLKYVLTSRKVKPVDIENKINTCLIEFGLEKYRNTKAKDLTLFEQYVISIARLILRPLDIVLVDDIFEKLDDEQKNYIVSLIKKLFIDKKVTTLVATSDEELLKKVCKRTIHFTNGSID